MAEASAEGGDATRSLRRGDEACPRSSTGTDTLHAYVLRARAQGRHDPHAGAELRHRVTEDAGRRAHGREQCASSNEARPRDDAFLDR